MRTLIHMTLIFLASLNAFCQDLGHAQIGAAGNDTVPISQSPFFAGKDEVTFDLQMNGKHPEIVVLKGTYMAKAMNIAAGEGTEDRIRMVFAGLVFTIDPENKDLVKIQMVGRKMEVPIQARVSRADLESGKIINIALPTQKKSVRLVGSVKGNGKISLRFHPQATAKYPKDSLELIECSGSIDVITWATEVHDSGEIRGAIGYRRPIERRTPTTLSADE